MQSRCRWNEDCVDVGFGSSFSNRGSILAFSVAELGVTLVLKAVLVLVVGAWVVPSCRATDVGENIAYKNKPHLPAKASRSTRSISAHVYAS